MIDGESWFLSLMCLKSGADPHLLFHRQGVSFSPLQYCKDHDKNFGETRLLFVVAIVFLFFFVVVIVSLFFFFPFSFCCFVRKQTRRYVFLSVCMFLVLIFFLKKWKPLRNLTDDKQKFSFFPLLFFLVSDVSDNLLNSFVFHLLHVSPLRRQLARRGNDNSLRRNGCKLNVVDGFLVAIKQHRHAHFHNLHRLFLRQICSIVLAQQRNGNVRSVSGGNVIVFKIRSLHVNSSQKRLYPTQQKQQTNNKQSFLTLPFLKPAITS